MAGVQWGFYNVYTSEFPNFKNSTPVIHFHGIFLMMWMVLLIIQPLLINAGKTKLHRTIGKVSWVLGPLIIISMFLVGRGSYGRSLGILSEQERLGEMVLDIRGYISFAIFWALAMYFRKNSASHMRYMIATGLLAIGPGVGRGLISVGVDFPIALTITDTVVLAIVGFLLGFDIYKKKNYKPFLIVFIVFLIGAILWQIKDTAAWQSFAKSYAAMFY
jgi:hypothetical protein